MYCLHDVRQRRTISKRTRLFRGIDDIHSYRIQLLKKRFRLFQIKLRIRCFDTEEEGIICRERELRHCENRMMRLRKPIQRQHPEHSEEAREQDRQLERDDNEGGPAMKRPPSNVDRVKPHGGKILHQVSADATSKPASKRNCRNYRAAGPQLFSQVFDWKGRESVHLPVSTFARAPGALDKVFRMPEFGEEAIHRRFHPLIETSGF